MSMYANKIECGYDKNGRIAIIEHEKRLFRWYMMRRYLLLMCIVLLSVLIVSIVLYIYNVYGIAI